MSPAPSLLFRSLLKPLLIALFAISPGLLSGASTARAQGGGSRSTEKPIYVEYKGVRIGMDAAEVRKKLGDPTDKGDLQDFFMFSETESAQVFYTKGKVNALSVNYLNEKNAPLPKVVLGTDIEAKPDGGMHKLVKYPEAGYWVSYNRTAGNDPLITVTMQKIQ